jgi:hypothetical protein
MYGVFKLWRSEHVQTSLPGLRQRLCRAYKASYKEKAVVSLRGEFRFSDFVPSEKHMLLIFNV